MEAFSDGVLAIIITIMVLEIKAPHDTDLNALTKLAPVGLSYVLSFIYVGIYWNNHHHMMQTVKNVDGKILWANLHLLFWLSLIPFTTAWLGQNHLTALPLALYGFVLLMAAFAYWLLQTLIIREHGKTAVLARAIGKDWKGKASPFLYLSAIVSSFFIEWLAIAIYIGVALIWLVPDKRIEAKFYNNED